MVSAYEENLSIGRLKGLLQAVIFSLFFAHSVAAGEPEKGFATLDWTVAETLLALGEEPKAIGDVASYQVWVSEPKLPTWIIDLGVRGQPNPEQIYRLSTRLDAQPLHFINSSFYAQATPMLKKFAKVDLVDFYREGDAWQNMLTATRQVAELIGKPQAATALEQHYLQKIAEIRPLVAPFTDRPIALVQFIDSRHLRIYAKNSPFGAVLNQLGFDNAWQGSHNNWGFETISVTQLADLPQNLRFVVVKPYPTNIEKSLKYNTLWQRLAMAKDPLILPAIWTFGAIPSAERFATALAEALQTGGEPW